MAREGCDRFALYLRPDPSGLQCVDPHALQAATAAQARWGGLHCTLCSFAAKAGNAGSEPRHGSSLRRAMADAAAAAASVRAATAAAGGAGGWSLGGGSEPMLTLYEFGAAGGGRGSGKYGVALPPAEPAVRAICEVLAHAELCGARGPGRLHITLGTLHRSAAEALLEALRNCEAWQLAIAKCAANERQLCTSRFNEFVRLT